MDALKQQVLEEIDRKFIENAEAVSPPEKMNIEYVCGAFNDVRCPITRDRAVAAMTEERVAEYEERARRKQPAIIGPFKTPIDYIRFWTGDGK